MTNKKITTIILLAANDICGNLNKRKVIFMTTKDIAGRYGIPKEDFENFLRVKGKPFSMNTLGMISVDDMNVFTYVEEYKLSVQNPNSSFGGAAAPAQNSFSTSPAVAGGINAVVKANTISNKIYSNIGIKICRLAKFLGFLGVLAIIIGLGIAVCGVFDSYDEMVIGGGVVAAGGLVIIISSFVVFALGQVVDDIKAIRIKVTAGYGTGMQPFAANAAPFQGTAPQNQQVNNNAPDMGNLQ